MNSDAVVWGFWARSDAQCQRVSHVHMQRRAFLKHKMHLLRVLYSVWNLLLICNETDIFVYCVTVCYVGRSKQTRPWSFPAGRITNPCQNLAGWVFQRPWERHGWTITAIHHSSQTLKVRDHWPTPESTDLQRWTQLLSLSVQECQSELLTHHSMFCERFVFFYATWWLHFDNTNDESL